MCQTMIYKNKECMSYSIKERRQYSSRGSVTVIPENLSFIALLVSSFTFGFMSGLVDQSGT